MRVELVAIFGMLGVAAPGIGHVQARGLSQGVRYELPIGMTVASAASPAEGWGLGLNLGLGVGPAAWPLTLGVDLRPVLWSENSRPVLLSAGDGSVLSGELTRRDQTIAWDLWLRFHPLVWMVRPFVEGTAGVRLVDFEYVLRFSGADGAVTEHQSSHQATWGVGAGVDIPLQHSRGRKDTPATVFCSISTRYTRGARTSANVPVGGDQVSFELSGDTMAIFLGITVSLTGP